MGARRGGAAASAAAPASSPASSQPVVEDQEAPVVADQDTQQDTQQAQQDPVFDGPVTVPAADPAAAAVQADGGGGDLMAPPVSGTPAARFVMLLDNSLHDPDGLLTVEGQAPDVVHGFVVAERGKRVEVPEGADRLHDTLAFLAQMGRAQAVPLN